MPKYKTRKENLKRLDFTSFHSDKKYRISQHDVQYDKIKSYYQTFDFINLRKRWNEVIGDRLAHVTSPLKIMKDDLIILSKDSSYSHHISFLSEEIKKNIFSLFPELKAIIKKLKFQTNESYFREKHHQRFGVHEAIHKDLSSTKPQLLHPQNPRYRILMREANELFKDIEDDQLKKTLMSLYLQIHQFQNH